ncbi:helix-turn-helix transcriptional regulator [Paenibacillus contaminans]|uniref:YafY family transcriptional regulator n=1 Tax=Paenibacillus contaminans TaxID=450362 RepID=A0A329M0A9_9BACL|nr:YafY family protein [Paenibacillus contaminans]RAV12992.1 YafY family transcriptional regulator [Paenibacillus contaminans]
MKLDRLLAITMLLLNRKRVSGKELAERFEVSLRTVYRDMEAINQAGIPIVSYDGATGGYEIMEHYRLDRQFLSIGELSSLVTSLKGIQSALGEQEMGGLLEKVGALVARTEKQQTDAASENLLIDINPWRNGNAEKQVFADLRQAVKNNNLVRFGYISSAGEESERILEPMGLALKWFSWYVYGYCRLRKDFRTFRLSRINELRIELETFERRLNPPIPLEHWELRSPKIPVLLQMPPAFRGRLENHIRHIETLENGKLLVHAEFPDESWVANLLLSFGPELKVLEPDPIRSRLRELALGVAANYE